MRAIFFSIAIWIRKILGLGPQHKFVNIYYHITDGGWLLRPIIDVPHRACMELHTEEVRLDSNTSKEVIIRTIKNLIEHCHYAKDHLDRDAVKGWKKFVEDHYCIVGSIKKSMLCFEPWTRQKVGHKNGHYVPSPRKDEYCAPISDIDEAYLALCKARDSASE